MSDRAPARTHTVVEADGADRLDRFAAETFGLPSRSRARKMLKRGDLLLNGEIVESCRRVRPGDVLSLMRAPPPPPVFAIPIEVVYVDAHMAVVMKPAGLAVSGNKHRTLEHALPGVLPPSDRPDALYVPRPVHRLDVRTGGLVMIARTGPAQVALGHQLQARTIQKRYRALLRGQLEGEGVIDRPVGGRDARSRWRAASQTRAGHCGWITAVDLWPVTGRTHQLRIHMANVGHPVLGDDLYTHGKVLKQKGLFLWAVALEMAHPVTGAPLRVSIEPPEKFDRLIARQQGLWERARRREAMAEE